MRRWYAAALSRITAETEEYDSGWQLLGRLAEDRPADLVVASRWLPGLTGPQVLAILRTAGARIPFVLVAPFCDSSVRALVRKVPYAALIDDPLDAVGLAEHAARLLSFHPAERARERQLRSARALRAHARRGPGSGRLKRTGSF